MRRSLQTLLRDERGLTVFEQLIAVGIGLGVLGVVFLMMNTSFTQTARINDRVEAVQRGRGTMEQITRQLRSQVCPSDTGAALLYAGDNTIAFYADLSGGAANPERRAIVYDPTGKRINEHRYTGTGTWPNATYPGWNSPTRSRQLLEEAVPASGAPIFSYYAFATSGTQTHVQLTTPITTSAELARIVRVRVSFVAQPTRTKQAPRSTTFQSAVDSRTTNPNNPSEGPRCL